ncbi:MAG: starch-binding protein, partial [Paludibacteraceae bacterium]|nr:starch-binding protein [Paludibacteraceae bacterium]
YLLKVTNEQIADGTLKTYTGITTEVKWRFATQAFFNCSAAKDADYSGNADFTEAGKPENWGPYYLAAQEGTTPEPEPEPEPTTETVYFVNAANWTKVNAYAWTTDPNASWPGVAANKEAEQIAGYDVYSYTAEAGTYANVIFNNGEGQQTADLVWTAGKYYVKDGWYTKEEAEAKLAAPAEYESVYFVDNQGWGKANIYTWTPEVGTWPGVAMTKEAEQLAGYDVYSYTVEKGTTFGGVIFNNGEGAQTADLQWTAGKYFVKDAWYTQEEALAKLAGPVTPPTITYVLMGVAGDWTTGIAMTQNPDNENEYVLLGQAIAEGDAVKVVTLTDGVATAWCGNVDEYSVERSYDENGNIVLAPGTYDFYYKVAEDLIYIGAVTPVEPDYEIMPIEMTNLEVQDMGEFVFLQASDLSMTGISVMLGVYEDGHLHEGSAVDWNGTELPIVEGNITKTVDEEKGDIYAGLIVVEFGEGLMGLDLTIYSAAVEAIEIYAEGATVVVNEATGTLEFTTEWEGYPVLVTVAGYEDVDFKEYEGAQISELTIGDDDNWYDFAVADVVAVVKDGNLVSLEGEYTSWATGAAYYVLIEGELATDEEEEQPELPLTENNLNPYAFGLESELSDDQATLTVTYRLNNSNATSVNVVVYNGTEVVATVPGTTTIGKNSVEVATADLPTGVELTWAVEVNGTSVEAPTREEKIYSFYHPSGLDIDINPENPTFGLLLVNEGMHSVKDKTEGYVSAGFGAGIFAFTPSFDLIPNGDKPGNNGGIEFTTTRADGTGTAYAPRRIRISEDGRIFVTSLNTDGNYLWEVNPNNFNEWTPIFKGTLNEQAELITEDSAFIAAPNNGFDVKGSGENLQLAMYSVNLSGITAAAMGGFRLHEYNLGTATEWTTAPTTTLVEGKYAINYTGTQVEYDNEGGYWIASYRGTASDANPGLVHINAEGVEDAKLVWNNVRQAGIRFNKDFTKLVVAGNNGAAKKATVYTISKDENGAPVLTEETVIDMAVVGNNLNDFAWDYAGNLYSCGNSSEKLAAWAMPYSGTIETPAATKYAFQLEGAVVESVELVGIVKRALTIGESTVVLTHEADGTPHIYNIVGEEITEVSQEGVIARDPENAGDLLAISDIAVTEDGKLVATNYMQTQSGDDYVDAGYKRGETRIYIWNDLAGNPAILFTSKMSSNWFRSKQGLTMAVKGTSDNMEIFMTGIHATKAWARASSYRVIDGVYTEPEVNHNDHYYFYDINDAIALETTVGTQYELNASPLGEMNWVLDAELINPTEIVESATNNVEIATSVALTKDLGKKYNGATYVTVGDQVLMVAPYATAEGLLAGVKVLDITTGLASAIEVAVANLDADVEATAAATAVVVDENELIITLVGDATLYTLTAELTQDPGPGTALDNVEVEVKAIKVIKNGQLIIIKNGVQYNVQGAIVK